MASAIEHADIPSGFLRIGPQWIDCGALRLLGVEPPCRIHLKALQVLLVLARQPGRTLSRDALLDAVWPNQDRTPDVVKQAVLEIRKLLGGESTTDPIETVPRVGYRLVADCQWLADASDPQLLALLSPPSTRTADPSEMIAAPAAGRGQRLPPRIRRSTLVLLLTLVALIVVRAYLQFGERVDTAAAVPAPATVILPPAWQGAPKVSVVTHLGGRETQPSIHPDGDRVAFTYYATRDGPARVGVVELGTGRVRLRETAAGVQELSPLWSNDGRYLLLQRLADGADCAMWRIDMTTGGGEQAVASCPESTAQYASWSPADDELALTPSTPDGNPNGRLVFQHLESGRNRLLVDPQGGLGPDLDPRYSPDGQRIAFRRRPNPHSDLFLHHFSDGQTRRLTRWSATILGHAWWPDGRSVIVSSNHRGRQELYRVGLDGEQAQPMNVPAATFPSVSPRSGRMVFVLERVRRKLFDVGLGEAGDSVPLLPESTGSESEGVQLAGRGVVFLSDRSGDDQLWFWPGSGSEAQRLSTYENSELSALVLSPDHRKALLTVTHGRSSRLHEVDLATGRSEPLHDDSYVVLQASYGADGAIWTVARQRGSQARLWRLERRPEGLDWVDLGVEADQVAVDAARGRVLFSDGRGGIFYLDERRLPQRVADLGIALVRFRAAGGRLVVLISGRDGITVQYSDYLAAMPRFEVGPRLNVDWGHSAFSLSDDGKRMLIAMVVEDSSDLGLIELTSAAAPRHAP